MPLEILLLNGSLTLPMILAIVQRCLLDFKALLGEVITAEVATQEIDGKTVFNSWSTAKRLLKPDPRYNKIRRKDREALWHRHVEEMLRKQTSGDSKKDEDHKDLKGRSPIDSSRVHTGSGRNRDRRQPLYNLQCLIIFNLSGRLP